MLILLIVNASVYTIWKVRYKKTDAQLLKPASLVNCKNGTRIFSCLNHVFHGIIFFLHW